MSESKSSEEQSHTDSEPPDSEPPPPRAEPPAKPRSLVRVALFFAAVLGVVFIYIYGVFPTLVAAGTAPRYGEDVVGVVKGCFGAAVTAFIIWEIIRKLRKQPLPKKWVRAALIAFALVGVAGYINFGDIGYPRVYHRWDIFHYYMGSKYNHELGYSGIYESAAVAQNELGGSNVDEVRKRKIRNLHNDTLEPATTAVERADEIKARFSPSQWEKFKQDVAWFRSTGDAAWWADMQTDHGYNPAPLWTTTGHFFASLGNASDRFLRFLSSLDLFCFAFMFFAMYWAFGERVTCIAVAYWGIQYPGNYFFTWGGFLRQDWLLALVLSTCLARKRKYEASGVALAYSILVRVFPLFFAIGTIGLAAWSFFKTRTVDRMHKRFIIGLVAGGVAFGAISIAVTSVGSYPEFVEHTLKLQAAPVTNLMGVRTIVVFDSAHRVEKTWNNKLPDAFDDWKTYRIEAVRQKTPFLLAITGSVCVLYGLVVFRTKAARHPWVAMGLAPPMLFATLELMNYYFCYFLLAVVLSRLGKKYELAAMITGTASALLCAWQRTTSHFDVRSYTQAIVYAAFGAAILALMGIHSKKERREYK